MKSGKLRHRIEIQKSIDTRSSSGAISGQTWEPFCYVWASIEPLSGREYFAAAQAQSSVTHKITIRYRAGIRVHYRAMWNNRIFDIQSILNREERNIELILFCSEADIGS